MSAVKASNAEIEMSDGRDGLPPGIDAFDYLGTMVLVVDEVGRCRFANAAFEEVVGASRRSVQGVSLYDWFVDQPTM